MSARVAVISDVHGNFPALQAVLSDIDRAAIDRIYCLGDLVGYFCMVNEVVDTLRERNIPSILGNHDDALVRRGGEIGRSRSASAILKRQAEYLSAENRAFLAALPETLTFEHAGLGFFCVHGGLDSAMDEYITSISEDYFGRHDFRHDVLLTGQTHKPMLATLGRFRYANPGAVGQPRDGDSRASYLVVDGESFTIRRVDYDASVLVREMTRLEFPASLCDVLPAERSP
jgi:putative phosphoesterase